MNQLVVRKSSISNKILRSKMGELKEPLTDEFHGPFFIIQIELSHIGQVANKGRELTLALTKRYFEALVN
jgi:hypothetical protein